MLEFEYPIGDLLGKVVIWQLGEFREQRALDKLIVLSEGIWADAAKEALEKIRRSD